jgi:hypothetical protein
MQTEGFARGDMHSALKQSFHALDELLQDPRNQAELFAMRQVNSRTPHGRVVSF